LIGFITLGIVGGIIAVVIVAVVSNVASKIGATVAEDKVSGQLKVLEAWPQNLDNIGTISARFSNPVVLEKSGIIFSGKMVITSTYEQTLSDMARSNGPYMVEGNEFVQFNGGADKAMTVVNWDFADGKNHVIRKPVHRYGKSGLYISKFTVNVVEKGGVSTRHFASVRVKNVAPVVSLPPNFTVDEGEVFSITGHFTDENWLDTHSATVYFGDNSKAMDLNVKETHFEPMGKGEVCISHAYCDNGLYSLRLVVRDDTGGIGEATMRITVLNVAPSVELPERVNTLVGQSIKLKALFTDPGWCDTHIGFWDTGDCTGTRRVVITEKHKPPVLEGKAEIVHIFKKCGRFENIVVITDDDGGEGEARMIVNANRVKNPDMRHGFRDFPDPGRNTMVVANDWYPYFATHEHIKGQVQFNAVQRHDINADGRWAQEVNLQGAGHAGIMQQIDVNAGWTYELTANYHFPAAGVMGSARIGVDPLGGRDAGAPQLVWVEGGTNPDWLNITVRATAAGNLITMFLDVNEWKGGDNTIRWDNVRLYQIQPSKEPSPQLPRRPCLEFSQFKNQQVFTAPFTHLDYRVIPRENNLIVTDKMEPEDVLKLSFDRRGVEVKFPDYTQYVEVQVANYESRLVMITLLKDGQPVLKKAEIIFNEVKQLIMRPVL
jgi:PKD repeat protein